MEQVYNFPVYGTQGGGLAREVNGTYIFITDPDCPGLAVGDEVPKEWDIQPANDLASHASLEERFKPATEGSQAVDERHPFYPFPNVAGDHS
jgi:hypothetical protein